MLDGFKVNPDPSSRSYCFGCHQVLEFANSRCQCVDESDARMAKAEADYERDNPGGPPPDQKGRLGFICFEDVLPMRASLKALSRIKY